MTRPQRKRASRLRVRDDSGMWSRSHTAIAALTIMSAALGVPACSRMTDGTAVASDANIPSTSPSTPSIVRTAPTSTVPTVTSAADAVQRTVTWWHTAHGMDMNVRVEGVIAPLVCGNKQYNDDRAGRCHDTILYDAEWVQNLLNNPPSGPVGLQITMAHEVGHIIQLAYGWRDPLKEAPAVGAAKALEVSADCLSGMYMSTAGLTDAAVDGGLAETALGFVPVRMRAFRDGLTTTDPNVCVTRYLP